MATADTSAERMGDVSGHVASDQGCIGCSYNLRGLPHSGVCPECGRPVADSLRGVLLQFAGREFVEKVNSGLGLVLNGILLQIALMVGGMLATFGVLSAFGPMAVRGMSLGISAVGVAVTLMILAGYFRYSEPDPGFVGSNVPDGARRALRAAVVVQAVIAGLQFTMQVLLYGNVVIPPELMMLFSLLLSLSSLAAWVVQFLSVMNYTMWMGRRIPDAFIMARAGMYRWLLPVIAVVGAVVLMLGPLVALVMYWNLLDRLRKHTRSILRSGGPAVMPKMAG